MKDEIMVSQIYLNYSEKKRIVQADWLAHKWSVYYYPNRVTGTEVVLQSNTHIYIYMKQPHSDTR